MDKIYARAIRISIAINGKIQFRTGIRFQYSGFGRLNLVDDMRLNFHTIPNRHTN